MRRSPSVLIAFAVLLLMVSAAAAAVREVRYRAVEPGGTIPPQMDRPEGRTRWDLTGVSQGRSWTRALDGRGRDVEIREVSADEGPRDSAGPIVLADPTGGDAAIRWEFPDRYPDGLRPGSRRSLEIEERSGGSVARLRIDLETVGVGWVHLPSGPREVALQRALVTRDSTGRNARTETLVHRWVDPRAGVVAEIAGPASADLTTRSAVTSATVLEKVLLGAATLKIYVDELWQGTYARVNYGWDRGTGTPISSLTTPSYSTMGALLAADSWDFSLAAGGTEIAATTTPVNAAETCNYAQCGYDIPGAALERNDKSFDVPASLDKTNDVAIREDRANDVTIWIRAGAQHEGRSGTFGTGESRFCYFGTDQNGKVRSQVPLWQFQHEDANGWYLQAGDTWSSAAFNCEQNIFNQLCGASQFLDKLYVAGSSAGGNCANHTGRQYSEVLKGGVVTLPSGHTFNALVVRQVADFCVYLTNTCPSFFRADEVRTFVHLWQVPFLGSVVLLQSPQTVADGSSFTTVNLTNVNFGLFPPRTIAVTGTTPTSVTLAWDPGSDAHRIHAYKVYWDTHSGGAGGYGFDSASNPAQVSFAGPAATVSGLEPGLTYYFTVTSLSNYTDPSSGIVTTYESLVYPTQVYGDPANVYPVEVQASTPCTPGSVVAGLTAERLSPDGVRLCWSADTTEPAPGCLVGYRVLFSATKQPRAGFVPLEDTGTETCTDVVPSPAGDESYFLVVAVGTGGEGPRGD